MTNNTNIPTMRKTILSLMVLALIGCAENINIETPASKAVWQEATKTISPTDEYLSQARWGDGNACLRLAECYIHGDGVKPEFMRAMAMLCMAEEYGGIASVKGYVRSLPEDDNTRLAFEAFNSYSEGLPQKGDSLSQLLINNGCADGYAVRGIGAAFQDDDHTAERMASIGAEEGSQLAKLVLAALPTFHDSQRPEDVVMESMAEVMPMFYQFLAEEYADSTAGKPMDAAKAVRYYLMADRHGCLGKHGARWLLNHKRKGGDIDLPEEDLQRLEKLAMFYEGPTAEELDVEEWVEAEAATDSTGLWENAPTDSIGE